MAPTHTQTSIKSTLLSVRLKAQIARTGPISLERFMDVCMADATAGYYPSKQPIGAGGDFTTAPEVSQVFGELLGLWAYAVWQSMGLSLIHISEPTRLDLAARMPSSA